MKKHISLTLLAASLLLAACNTDEKESTNEQDTNNGVQVEQEETTTNEEVVEDEIVAEEKEGNVEPKDSESEVATKEVVIYGGDANFESIEATSTVDYSYSNDGNITQFLIDKLDLSSYYKDHKVSADETTITLDFKEDITFSQNVQGSAGASIFSDSITTTFFKNIPDLQSLELRVNGEEKELDHTTLFMGTITRDSVEESNPDLFK